MKIGAAYPTTEAAGDPKDVRRFVRAIEDLGFDYMMAYDHVVKVSHEGRDRPLAGPYTEKHSFHDPFVLFGFAAAISETLEFSTGVLVLPQRPTALTAQQAADVDLLSNERLRLGVGIGWNYVEYEALGQDFKTRAKRIEEQVGLLRRLWTEPLVRFEGRSDRIDNAGINPRPRRQIPLWLGGYSEPAYERGARLGDGFVFAGSLEACVGGWERVKHHLGESGRDAQGFGREMLAHSARGVEQTADHLKAWRDIGGTHGAASSMEMGFGRDIEAHIRYLEQVRRRLG